MVGFLVMKCSSLKPYLLTIYHRRIKALSDGMVDHIFIIINKLHVEKKKKNKWFWKRIVCVSESSISDDGYKQTTTF